MKLAIMILLISLDLKRHRGPRLTGFYKMTDEMENLSIFKTAENPAKVTFNELHQFYRCLTLLK